MLRKLVEVASRFRQQSDTHRLPPVSYKPKQPRWIINLEGDLSYIEGPYSSRDRLSLVAPDCYRSGRRPRPFLLIDQARYVLATPEAGKKETALRLHQDYLDLLKEAYRATAVTSLKRVLDFCTGQEPKTLEKPVDAKDLIAFRVDGELPTEDPRVQSFWAQHLAKDVSSRGQCGVCGQEGRLVRLFPRPVSILGSKCQIASFDDDAFRSFGKIRMGNAPLCFECASSAVDALDFLLRKEQHRRTLYRNPDRNAPPLHNQLAVFWLTEKTEVVAGGRTYDMETLLGSIVGDVGDSARPAAELSQLEALLAAPWTGKETSLRLDESRFCLAVLSANKARLVVREWLEADLAQVQASLEKFVEATGMVGSGGEAPRPQTVVGIREALGSQDPNLIRSLLRTAYLGTHPLSTLSLSAAARLRRLFLCEASLRERNRRGRERVWDEAWPQALAAAIKLGLYYDKKEVKDMAELNPGLMNPAYLCGRLLAILEEAQQRATFIKSKKRLDTTIVNRFYVGASSAPGATFGRLIPRATVAHLPKAGREVNVQMEGVMSKLHDIGGFPRTLTMAQQAEFALGFYHHRATLRAGHS